MLFDVLEDYLGELFGGLHGYRVFRADGRTVRVLLWEVGVSGRLTDSSLAGWRARVEEIGPDNFRYGAKVKQGRWLVVCTVWLDGEFGSGFRMKTTWHSDKGLLAGGRMVNGCFLFDFDWVDPGVFERVEEIVEYYEMRGK